MKKLAINGGKPVREAKSSPWPAWPVWNKNEETALLEVLNSGVWSYNGPKEVQFNKMFAEYIGTKYAVSAVNGNRLSPCSLSALMPVIIAGRKCFAFWFKHPASQTLSAHRSTQSPFLCRGPIKRTCINFQSSASFSSGVMLFGIQQPQLRRLSNHLQSQYDPGF